MDYKCKEDMIDNRMVKDSHQEGIKRVVQKEHEKRDGHDGKMGMGKRSEAGFKVPDNTKTPRRA